MRTNHLWLMVLAGLISVGCPADDTDDTNPVDTDVVEPGDPVVVVSGSFWLQLGEQTTLSATTANADAETYVWSTSDEAVLTIDDAGLATAIGLGDVTVTATGATSGVEGIIGLVVTQDVPHLEEWAASGHADRTAEAFINWNEDGEVPASCAGCHTGSGFRDRIGEDGSTADQVDNNHPIGQVIDCATCHNPTANELDHVIFPSGAEIDQLGGEARCMTCHQGRSAGADVDTKINESGVGLDEVSDKLGFTNIHYYAAGATLYAAQAAGGYQYEGQVYDWKFRHVEGVDTCTDCHNPHSLEVKVETCATCHDGVTSTEDLKKVRMLASATSDYDGDGDLAEGLHGEVDGLRAKLRDGIHAYPIAQGNDAICYDSHAYPYFFVDTDKNGECNGDEASYANAYKAWTPRLLKAAYNYQVSLKDPGAYAHNGKYLIQLMHDSIVDLNEGLTTKIDMESAARNDAGHFNGAGEAARHWDGDEAVSGSCSKCHGGSEGYAFWLEYGVGSTSVEPDNGLECSTCHAEIPGYGLVEPASLAFPGGVEVSDAPAEDKLCGTCHSGRESMATIDANIAADKYGFRNVHYLPAAAVRYGASAQVGYQYDGNSYAGQWTGHIGGDKCTDCHNPVETGHSFQVSDAMASCQKCHASAKTPRDIRGRDHKADYDGDGDVTETLYDELTGMEATLMAGIQQYATDHDGAICYDSHTYPYWFKDTNANGQCDGGAEANYGNQYKAWNPTLMKATHNAQIFHKESGAWAHNFDYMGQLLFDATVDVTGGDQGLTRP